jgi:hypothetical protein
LPTRCGFSARGPTRKSATPTATSNRELFGERPAGRPGQIDFVRFDLVRGRSFTHARA